jgi:uncharacterized protein YhbP (UPF0306 family)
MNDFFSRINDVNNLFCLYAYYKFDKRDEDVNQLTYKDCKYTVMNKIQTSKKKTET